MYFESFAKLRSFSLANLLLIMVIASLGLALIIAYRQIAAVEPELRRLREEARPLQIQDPDKPHVVSLPTGDNLTWRWRVYLPKGCKYRLTMETEHVPEKGTPRILGTPLDSGFFRLPEGEEFFMNADLRFNGTSGTLRLIVVQNGVSIESVEKRFEAPSGSIRGQLNLAGQERTQIFDNDEPVVLVRIRPVWEDLYAPAPYHFTSKIKSVYRTFREPTRGFLLWLTPIRKQRPIPVRELEKLHKSSER